MKKVILVILALLFIVGNAMAQCPNTRPGCSEWYGDMNISNGNLTIPDQSYFIYGTENGFWGINANESYYIANAGNNPTTSSGANFNIVLGMILFWG